jgi:hypothetical protein
VKTKNHEQFGISDPDERNGSRQQVVERRLRYATWSDIFDAGR